MIPVHNSTYARCQRKTIFTKKQLKKKFYLSGLSCAPMLLPSDACCWFLMLLLFVVEDDDDDDDDYVV